MGELGVNKIFGALLATALGMMALMQLPAIVFGSESAGHHGDEHAEEQTLSEKMCSQFHYCVEIAEAASTGEAEEVFDLGAALAMADVARGERTFSGQCTTCHTITPGGANGTGPNLHNTVGADKAHVAGFSYSGALSNAEGSWTYENLDAWLKSPAGYVRGTSMSFAGIKRDTDRANVIAYLAANTEGAPAFPAPMEAAAPAEDEAVPAEGEAVPADAPAEPVEGEAAPAEGETAPVEAPAEETVEPT
ncbi:MAG: cytochrome c family protein [Hyphomonas sp.]